MWADVYPSTGSIFGRGDFLFHEVVADVAASIPEDVDVPSGFLKELVQAAFLHQHDSNRDDLTRAIKELLNQYGYSLG